MKGFEPATYGLQIRCSTVELHQPLLVQDSHLHLLQANPTKINKNSQLFLLIFFFQNLAINKRFYYLSIRQTGFHVCIVKMLQRKGQKLIQLSYLVQSQITKVQPLFYNFNFIEMR